MAHERIKAGYVPVGVKVAPETPENYPRGEKYRGISYCDAVRLASAGTGRALLLETDSIEICRWSPVVLGFCEPDPKFDLKVGYNLPFFTRSIILAPVGMYTANYPPDSLLVRAAPSELKKILELLDPAEIARELAGEMDKSAISVLDRNHGPRDVRRIRWVNRLLASFNWSRNWRNFTKWALDRQWTTYLFDLFLDRYLANMSMCRNSTAIPLLTGKVNISCFCTGGIAWGLNSPAHMTCGMPFHLYRRLPIVWE